MQCPTCGGTHFTQAEIGRKVQCRACGCVYTEKEAAGPKVPAASLPVPTRTRSSRQERFNARRIQGKVTLNSGAMGEKGDVRVPGIARQEAKTTRARSYVLHLSDLRKIIAQSERDEIPHLVISFEDNLQQQFVVIEEGWFQTLLRAYLEANVPAHTDSIRPRTR